MASLPPQYYWEDFLLGHINQGTPPYIYDFSDSEIKAAHQQHNSACMVPCHDDQMAMMTTNPAERVHMVSDIGIWEALLKLEAQRSSARAGGGCQLADHYQEPPQQLKVSPYSAEQRKERILRYLKKRNHRNFNKTIKYACRKTLADKRVRFRGRFAKNNEVCQVYDETETRTGQNFQGKQLLCSFEVNDPAAQHMVVPQDEEAVWLNQAITDLMHYHMFPEDTYASQIL